MSEPRAYPAEWETSMRAAWDTLREYRYAQDAGDASTVALIRADVTRHVHRLRLARMCERARHAEARS